MTLTIDDFALGLAYLAQIKGQNLTNFYSASAILKSKAQSLNYEISLANNLADIESLLNLAATPVS